MTEEVETEAGTENVCEVDVREAGVKGNAGVSDGLLMRQ